MKKRKAHLILIALVLLFSIGIAALGYSIVATEAAEKIPVFSGKASVELNKNKPTFSKKEITTISYEKYGELDKYGRCTTALACIGKDLMPTEERESIGMVKPTGWNQNKYPGIVDSDPPYLFNRCHMIGYQLTGENANEKNLITGTRYMNVEGMLPYENLVADYINSTGNHVMYRVTPFFEGKNLVCSGIQIEAYSVEDKGKGICFNAYCYNVQPGVEINYLDGSNSLAGVSADDFVINATGDNTAETKQVTNVNYIGNKKSKKFHYPSCSGVETMAEKNKLYFNGSRDELIEQGYDPCKICNP